MTGGIFGGQGPGTEVPFSWQAGAETLGWPGKMTDDRVMAETAELAARTVDVKNRLSEVLGSLAASPHRVANPHKPGLGGVHSARGGNERVIYHIDDHRRRVDVAAIENRSDIYR